MSVRGSSKYGLPPGLYRSGRGYCAKIWVDGIMEYVGWFKTVEAADVFARQCEENVALTRLRRRRGTVYCRRPPEKTYTRPWVALTPRPVRKVLGYYHTKWAAECALAAWLSTH